MPTRRLALRLENGAPGTTGTALCTAEVRSNRPIISPHPLPFLLVRWSINSRRAGARPRFRATQAADCRKPLARHRNTGLKEGGRVLGGDLLEPLRTRAGNLPARKRGNLESRLLAGWGRNSPPWAPARGGRCRTRRSRDGLGREEIPQRAGAGPRFGGECRKCRKCRGHIRPECGERAEPLPPCGGTPATVATVATLGPQVSQV